MRTAAVRSTTNVQPSPQTQTTFQVPAKRPRTQNTTRMDQEEKRGRGRPTNIKLAGRERSQSQLNLSTPQRPQNGTSAFPIDVPSSFPSTQSSFPFTFNTPTSKQPSPVPSSFPSSLGSLIGSQERHQSTPEINSIEDTSMDVTQESEYDI